MDNNRDFEKISFEQFCKDVKNDINLYNNYKLPVRDSEFSAGYDIYLLEDIILKPHEIKKIPTGIKSYFNRDEVLLIVLKSSTGFKYNTRLVNQVGIVDADYYNNKSNEGHIFIKIQNEGTEALTINKGDRFAQGIFMNFLITDDDMSFGDRTGGFGSTGKGE